jgi:hypothetical protein|tara:strand:- start:402 stop:734 length:333 start_codon:yes stop_codon:yes gene_type:complete
MEYKMIPCKICGGKMPELRLTNYGYNFCVTCSETGNMVKPKQGVAVMMGEGDHTWVETIIMDEDQYKIYQNQQNALKNLGKNNKTEILNMDNDDDEKTLYGPVSIISFKE